VEGFLGRVRAWHASDGATSCAVPEHSAICITVGGGKTAVTLGELPDFVRAMEAIGNPHRVLWLVPHHKLSSQASFDMQAQGIHAAVWRGREASDPDAADQKMCLNIAAVNDALMAGADVESEVCGKEGGARCPFYDTCGYQRQKRGVAQADVIVAAHQTMFHALPTAMGRDLACVVIDEGGWWNSPLRHSAIRLASVVDDLDSFPVLKGKNKPDGVFTKRLRQLTMKVQTALAGVPDGGFLGRAALQAVGLTPDECAEARSLVL
jgi:putative DNA primase/helicase